MLALSMQSASFGEVRRQSALFREGETSRMRFSVRHRDRRMRFSVRHRGQSALFREVARRLRR